MIRKLAPIALAIASAMIAPAAFAQSAGTWTVGIGAHNVAPDGNNGTIAAGTLEADVGDSVRPTVTLEYFIRDNLGIEVLAAWPFQHDISIKPTDPTIVNPAFSQVGTTKHLPPTVSLQYHFGQGRARPFVGGGVNYTYFFSEDTEGALAGSDLELKNSWGLAAHVGLDFDVTETSAIRVDARWIDIDTKVRLNGADLGTVHIDPIVYGAAYVMQF